MGPVLLALLVVAIVLAAPFASRRLRRVTQADGETAPSRKAGPAGRAAVPRPEVQPSANERQPFACDSGLTIGGREP